jgi:hypothetical protein
MSDFTMILPEPCHCDDGMVATHFVDYGCAGGGWAYESHIPCNGTGVFRRQVEYRPWIHSIPPSALLREPPQ